MCFRTSRQSQRKRNADQGDADKDLHDAEKRPEASRESTARGRGGRTKPPSQNAAPASPVGSRPQSPERACGGEPG